MIHLIYYFAINNVVPLIAFYIVAGIVYTFIKWIVTLFKIRRKVLAISAADIAAYKKRFPTIAGDDSNVVHQLRKIIVGKVIDTEQYPLVAKDNISLLVMWALFWPINLVYTIVGDFCVEIWHWFCTTFISIYQKLVHMILPE